MWKVKCLFDWAGGREIFLFEVLFPKSNLNLTFFPTVQVSMFSLGPGDDGFYWFVLLADLY